MGVKRRGSDEAHTKDGGSCWWGPRDVETVEALVFGDASTAQRWRRFRSSPPVGLHGSRLEERGTPQDEENLADPLRSHLVLGMDQTFLRRTPYCVEVARITTVKNRGRKQSQTGAGRSGRQPAEAAQPLVPGAT